MRHGKERSDVHLPVAAAALAYMAAISLSSCNNKPSSDTLREGWGGTSSTEVEEVARSSPAILFIQLGYVVLGGIEGLESI